MNEDAIQRELKELVRSSVKERRLSSPQLFIGDRCSGLVEEIVTVYPKAKYQRRTVHFYRNMLSMTPRSKMKTVAAMLKAIHAQKDKDGNPRKSEGVSAKLRKMKRKEAADKLDAGIEKTLTYMSFPTEHWPRIRSNNVIED